MKNGTNNSTVWNRWIRISLRAQDKNTVFCNLLTHLNVETLEEAFKAQDGTKALGIDGISKTEYGMKLKDNLQDLTHRIHTGTYRPQPKREVLLPKANGTTRPIAIACFEDKLVDHVVGKILTPLYEPLFIKSSFGYRPNKAPEHAIDFCYNALSKNQRQYVVEVDFSNFFNTIPHQKLMQMIGKRSSDKRFNGLIGRFLKAELITHDGHTLVESIGTSQGSSMSPILANIYLNEVLDQWFLKNVSSYDNIIVRYADDAVFFFRQEKVAQQFMKDLQSRVKEYELVLNTEKTLLVHLPKKGHQKFNFLGFTFYWGKQNSRIILKVKTQKERLIKAIQDFERWIKKVRNSMKLNEIWKLAQVKIKGHFNYYGFWMNATKLNHFYFEATKSLYKWLNRRSQKRSYTWESFKEKLKNTPLIAPLNIMKLKKLGWNPYA